MDESMPGSSRRQDWTLAAEQEHLTMAETIPCPSCKRPVPVTTEQRPSQFPFCGERCRAQDLGAWFAGRYAIAGQELDVIDEQRGAHGVDRAPHA